jgi:phospholipase C
MDRANRCWSFRPGRVNYVDHSITDQSSVLRFVEDNWLGGQRIGQGSFDAIANSITQMFDFSQGGNSQGSGGGVLILDPSSGQPASQQNQQ